MRPGRPWTSTGFCRTVGPGCFCRPRQDTQQCNPTCETWAFVLTCCATSAGCAPARRLAASPCVTSSAVTEETNLGGHCLLCSATTCLQPFRRLCLLFCSDRSINCSSFSETKSTVTTPRVRTVHLEALQKLCHSSTCWFSQDVSSRCGAQLQEWRNAIASQVSNCCAEETVSGPGQAQASLCRG